MFEGSSRSSTVFDSGRAWAAACGTSLVVHLSVLTGLEGLYKPVAWPPPRAASTVSVDRVTILEFTPPAAASFAARDPAQPLSGAPVSSEAVPPEAVPSETAPSSEERPVRTQTGPPAAEVSRPPPNAEVSLPPPTDVGLHGESLPRVLFPRQPRDPRLYVGSITPGALPTESDLLSSRLNEILAAVPDSMEAQTRREASMGYARRNGQLTLGSGKLIMPTDGRVWEKAQMMIYNEVAVRDSILRDRARVMRAHADSLRDAGARPGIRQPR